MPCSVDAPSFPQTDRPAATARPSLRYYVCLGIIAATAFSLCLSAFAQSGPGQTTKVDPTQKEQTDQTIKLKAELIQLTAVVTGARGQLIPGLSKEDFELLENGKPQEISFFSAHTLGGDPRTVSATGVTPSVRTPPGIDQPSRSVVLFVDTLHLLGSNLLQVKQSLWQFIREKLSPNDRVSIVASGGTVGLSGQFTQDRRALLNAIERLTPRTTAEETLFTPGLAADVERDDPGALEVAMNVITNEEGQNLPPQLLQMMAQSKAKQILWQSSYWRNVTLAALRRVIERLGEVPGQRLVAVVSDGFTLFEVGGLPDATVVRSVTSRATALGVRLYSIDARGLYVPRIFTSSIRGAPLHENPRLNSYWSAAEEEVKEGLNALARDTGGQAFFNTNDLAGSVQAALDENRIYYTLAYHPSIDGKANEFRQITIKVKGHAEYKVRAQRGYFAEDLIRRREEEAQTPELKLGRALGALLPEPAIPTACFPSFLVREGSPETMMVQVYIGGERLAYQEAPDRRRLRLAIWTIVVDSSGKVVRRLADSVDGSVPSEQLSQVKTSGFSYSKSFEVKPGLYQVRVGVYDHGNGLVGTAFSWVEIPDVSRGRVTLSNIVLSRAQAGEAGTLQTAGNHKRPPVIDGVHLYSVGDAVIYHVALYNAADKTTGPSAAQMRIEMTGDGETVYKSDWSPVTSRQIGQDKRAIYIGGQLQLSEMPPGIYELSISVKQANKNPIQQKATFVVEPAVPSSSPARF